jgi:hypothetical protein
VFAIVARVLECALRGECRYRRRHEATHPTQEAISGVPSAGHWGGGGRGGGGSIGGIVVVCKPRLGRRCGGGVPGGPFGPVAGQPESRPMVDEGGGGGGGVVAGGAGGEGGGGDQGSSVGSGLPPPSSEQGEEPLAQGDNQSESSEEFPGIETPYDVVFQETTDAAMAARAKVEAGATLWRIGTTGKSFAAEAQYWSLENPLTTPGYQIKYGVPAENWANADFVEAGTLKPGQDFVTRTALAPDGSQIPGAGIEVIVVPDSVDVSFFSFIGPLQIP